MGDIQDGALLAVRGKKDGGNGAWIFVHLPPSWSREFKQATFVVVFGGGHQPMIVVYAQRCAADNLPKIALILNELRGGFWRSGFLTLA